MAHGGRDQVNDEQLREIYGNLMTARGGRRLSACPAPEAVLALVRREGLEEARLATLDHVMSCAECRSEFDLLRSIEVAGVEAGGASRPGRRWMAPVALAASILLAVIVGRYALPGTPERDIVRSGSGDGVTLLAPPAETASGSPLLFVWHPLAGASRYRLEVMNGAGDVVLEAETADTAILLRSAADLQPGEYQWWVGATAPGALRSELRPLRLTAQ
jgi:hypothetical protein